MIVNIDPERLYSSRGLMPHLAALRLPPAAHLEVVVDVVQARGVLIAGGREIRVMRAEIFPSTDELVAGLVAVVWGVEGDGEAAVLYMD